MAETIESIERRLSHQVKIPITLAGRAARWIRFVRGVERGYRLLIDNYKDDLRVRDTIEEVLLVLDDRDREWLIGLIESADTAFVAATRPDSEQGTARVVYYASLAAGGSTWSAPVAISDAPGADAYRPNIGADAAGNLIVTWLDLRDPPTVDVRESRRPAGSQTWTASRLVGDSREFSYRLATPSLTVRSDGSAYLVWEDKASALFVVGAEYDPATDTWSVPGAISDGPVDKDAEQPAAFLTDTQVAVIWRDERLDVGGDIFVRTGSLGAGTGEDHTTYTLDRLYRLTSVGGPDGARTYGYDPVGNRLSRVLSGTTTAYTYDRADRITGAGITTFTVNAVGATTGRGSDVFSYDQVNRLTSATVGATSETYAYDGDSVRFSRQVAAEPSTRYVTDPAAGLPVTIDDGTRKYVWGHGLAYAVSGSTIEVDHADRLGSVRVVTDVAGAVVASFRTDEFGIPTSSTGAAGSPFRYTGEPRDASALTYLRARYYDPSAGRFLSRDPFAGVGTSPLSLNRYSYVHNNPATAADPSGHCLVDTAADVAFVVFDLLTLAFGPSEDRDSNTEALALDAGGVLIPCAAGLGMVRRVANAAGAAISASTWGARLSHLGPDVVKQVDEAIQRAASGTIRFTGQDGKIFYNTASGLPSAPVGYYTEWTAAASGATRGTDRVIIGGNPASPDAIWYWDHSPGQAGYIQLYP